ncbi:MAG: hypothetical protein K6T99_12350 [Armatimonadetes bacterium]|nr:hypothetical protein [Armatimonadota bacterium]
MGKGQLTAAKTCLAENEETKTYGYYSYTEQDASTGILLNFTDELVT